MVISDHYAARGLQRAKDNGIDAVYIDRSRFKARATCTRCELRNILRDHFVDYVVMAGYMRLLGKEVLDFFPNRVVNLHPALLPSFPGANGIRDAFDHGVKVTGVTVHFANEKFDEGPIIAQEAVVIAEDDTLETLEAKIHEVEHRLYAGRAAAHRRRAASRSSAARCGSPRRATKRSRTDARRIEGRDPLPLAIPGGAA